ncbi:MAG: sensor histidine kinase [Marinirhabdus sp.]
MQKHSALTRWLFILGSVAIIALILWNTYAFFQQLKEAERNKMETWALAEKELQNDDPNAEISEIAVKVMQGNTSTPMISFTYSDSTYIYRNITESQVDTDKKRQAFIAKFASENKPIDIFFKDELIETVYYGNSTVLNKLKFYPIAIILIIVLFVLAGYFFYRTSKSAEQNQLWAGMAKETAHQIGTPLSSLVGWTELLKSENVNPGYITEMEKDVARLKTITERFSKIGSVPALRTTDLVAETRETCDYLQRRTSKLIQFEISLPDHPVTVQLNPQLFSWTLENLVKNGIDAMRGKGTITVTLAEKQKRAMLRVTDTGKGVSKKNQKRIFKPGYTTKKRGWGLGLSLARRIIEEYHNGKIYIKKSAPGKGTTIEVMLRKNVA